MSSHAVASSAGRAVVETLNVVGMMMNRRLAHVIANAGMSGFLIKLEYKCAWNRAECVKAMYQRCARCFLYCLLPLLLVLTACGQQNLPQPTALPTATQPAVSPVHFAQESRQVVDEFVRRRQMVDDTWRQIRDDFDRWSADLIACQPAAMHEALDEFANSFRAVTEHARGITRTQATGVLADILIAAAEEEEEVFRRLRDYWQPNNVVLFEEVEKQRTQAAQAQREAEDRAIELREALGESPDPEATEVFFQALELIKSDWLGVHDEYAALRNAADTQGADDLSSNLGQLAERMVSIVDALGELPELAGTAGVVSELLRAARAEQEIFRSLGEQLESEESLRVADGIDSDVIASSPEPPDFSAPDDSADGADPCVIASNQGPPNFPAVDDGVDEIVRSTITSIPAPPDFSAVDDSIQESEIALEQASGFLQSFDDADLATTLSDLQTFTDEYVELRSAWDGFHGRYNGWRKSEGGCDRAEIVRTLDVFALRISNIRREVRNLPLPADWLPIHALLVEAISMEENSIRRLYYTWQPFTVNPFNAVHRERIEVDRLRRAADVAMQERMVGMSQR